ncbi:MAG: methyl-accepting chemotaxis protein [Bacillota bacterium]
MKWFYNLKISAKILSGFIIVALIAGVIGITGVISIKTIDENDQALYELNTFPIVQITNIQNAYNQIRVAIREAMLNKDTSKTAGYMNSIRENISVMKSELANFAGTLQTDEGRVLVKDLESAINEFEPYLEELIGLVNANKNDEAYQNMQGKGLVLAENIQNPIEELVNIKVEMARQKADENKDVASQSTVIMIVLFAVGIGIAIGAGILISGMISKPVRKLNEIAGKIAQGDLNVSVDINTKDEVGELAGSYREIIAAVKTLLDETGKLVQSALEGQLSARGDVSAVKGGYAEIIRGFNNTLDAIVVPLTEAQEVMRRIAVNDYTLEIKGQYKGDLKEFADSINAVHERLLSLLDVAIRVSKGDTSRLDEFKKAGKRSENDKLLPSFTAMMQAIEDLINEVNKLTGFMLEGEVNARGDDSKFEGGYREIIQGINKTIDAVLGPIQETANVLYEVAKGNLQVSVKGDYKGGHAKLKNALNDTIKSFNEVLNEINSAAQQVAAGAKQVSDASQALSQGASEQASSVEELTASIEEISEQTKKNAANSNQANELAMTAKDAAAKGNEQMKEMLKAMNDINETSSNISKIIKVIDDIAFQTNILALNAAVEAARAGQHGKGFAVVAEEVRNLAARSANAAKETTILIESSIEKAESGRKIADDTARALNMIMDEVTKSATLVGEIAAASNEQATAIAQVSQGIAQISEVIQTNSATSEESAAASEELSGQAEMLKEMVNRFKLKKADKSINNLDELNPEVIKMLEDLAEKKKKGVDAPGENCQKEDSKKTIVLSDKEFGKY